MSSTQLSAVALDFLQNEAKDVAGPFAEQLEATIRTFRITSLAAKARDECLRAIPTHSNETLDGFVAIELLSITRKTLLKLIHAAEDATTDQQVDSDQDSQLNNLKRRKPKEPHRPIDDDAIRESAGGYLDEIAERDTDIANSGALTGDATDKDVRASFLDGLDYPENFHRGPLPSAAFKDAMRHIINGIVATCTTEARLAPIIATGQVTKASVAALMTEIVILSGKLKPPSDEM